MNKKLTCAAYLRVGSVSQLMDRAALRRNKKAVLEYATKALERKGYDREEANDLALKAFENMEANPNEMTIDWFLEKVLDKATYEESYGIQML